MPKQRAAVSQSLCQLGSGSLAARLARGCWGGVVVLMQVGDSRRHKDISHAAQRG